MNPELGRALQVRRAARVDGVVEPPGSKSISHRALNLALVGQRPITISNILEADDIAAFRAVLAAMGWRFDASESPEFSVEPPRRPRHGGPVRLDCRSAGTLLRFLVATCSVTAGDWLLDGSPRLRERPIGPLVATLRELGARIEELGQPGCAPVRIRGGSLASGRVELDARDSSQDVSALLMAALRAEGPIEIRTPVLVSSPYVDTTIRVMADFGAEVTFSDTTDRLALNFDQPYVTEYGVSRHFGIARSEINSPDDITEYSLDGTDVDYGYGIPVAEETVLFVSAHYETDEVLNTNLVSRTDQEAQDFLMRHGNDFTSYLMSARLARDTRDSSLAPTEGFRQSFSTKATLPVGDLRYYTARFLHSHYFPFDEDKDHVLGALGEVSYADSFGGYVYPFYNRYFLGGPSTLRGFESGSVGEKDEDGDALGGKFRIRGSLDYYLPFPLISEFDGVRTSIFTDAGAIFQDASDLEFGELRSSFGVSIRWISPLGPFKFIIATPIQSEDDDRTRSFDFTLGIL